MTWDELLTRIHIRAKARGVPSVRVCVGEEDVVMVIVGPCSSLAVSKDHESGEDLEELLPVHLEQIERNLSPCLGEGWLSEARKERR